MQRVSLQLDDTFCPTWLAVIMNYIHMCVSHRCCLQVRGIDVSFLAFYIKDALKCVSSVTKEIKHTLLT